MNSFPLGTPVCDAAPPPHTAVRPACTRRPRPPAPPPPIVGTAFDVPFDCLERVLEHLEGRDGRPHPRRFRGPVVRPVVVAVVDGLVLQWQPVCLGRKTGCPCLGRGGVQRRVAHVAHAGHGRKEGGREKGGREEGGREASRGHRDTGERQPGRRTVNTVNTAAVDGRRRNAVFDGLPAIETTPLPTLLPIAVLPRFVHLGQFLPHPLAAFERVPVQPQCQ